MAGNKNSGRKRKSVEQHKLDGTYRADRHGSASGAARFEKKPAARAHKNSARGQRRWIKTAADERAVRNGCRFDERLARHVADFFRQHLKHSKGRWAGEPLDLLKWQRDDLIFPLFGWLRKDGTRRFRRAYIEIPKKNGKSTLASGIAIYLLTADAEPGAEVYSFGADESQASIVFNESANMVRASPSLTEILKIKETNRRIIFNQTKSFFRSCSSSPSGKQGLNIHGAICDELHEWYGSALWDRIRYGFASREQPLLLSITNAGQDKETICGQQHDYAKGVLSGAIHDDEFFPLIYSADEADDWTKQKIWRKANPSLGKTITIDGFKADVLAAKNNPRELSNFLRLRLGIWNTGDTAWLDREAWAQCKKDYTTDDLLGLPCYGGLDLAKVYDLTALALLFPDEDGRKQFRQLVWFWMPEETARERKDLASYLNWAAGGYLRLTPGEVCDYDFVLRDMVEIFGDYDLRGLAFDPWNAEQLTQTLEAEHGVRRVSFGQTIGNYAEPTSEYERLVIARSMHHNNHPVLTWQAGHVNVKTDASGNKRPVKRKHGDYRTIDGIAAAVMALGLSMTVDDGPNFYENHSVEVI